MSRFCVAATNRDYDGVRIVNPFLAVAATPPAGTDIFIGCRLRAPVLSLNRLRRPTDEMLVPEYFSLI
jgi:hypothetical protein